MKKFKHAETYSTHAPHRPSPFGAVQPQLAPNGMHDSIMNGPTLSPEGQVPIAERQAVNGHAAISPPPGLRSPPGPPGFPDGYTHRVRPATFQQDHTQSSTSVRSTNGKVSGHPATTAWSPQYQPSRLADTPQQAQPVPPSANPFHNSFDRPQPNTPLSNGPALSPPRHTYSPANPYLSTTNGLPSQTYSLPPPLPPPVKRQSSPPTPATNHVLSSSPVAGPNLQKQAPASPGFSPTKQTSPRPTPLAEVIPDSALSPTLQQQAPPSPGVSPVKHSSPRPAPLANNVSSSPVAGPALLSRAAPSPGFSPTKQCPPGQPLSIVNGVLPPVETLNPSPSHE